MKCLEAHLRNEIITKMLFIKKMFKAENFLHQKHPTSTHFVLPVTADSLD